MFSFAEMHVHPGRVKEVEDTYRKEGWKTKITPGQPTGGMDIPQGVQAGQAGAQDGAGPPHEDQHHCTRGGARGGTGRGAKKNIDLSWPNGGLITGSAV